jgi:hypothetical protein
LFCRQLVGVETSSDKRRGERCASHG